MKKIFILSVVLLSAAGCTVLEEQAESMRSESDRNTAGSLSNSEITNGLKEALITGVKNGVDVTSKTDGFLKNDEIKLPFPPSALRMKEKAEDWGMESQVERIVTTLNRAAEDASTKAKPIFVDAIKNMSVRDGRNILNGGNGAATDFLRKNTTEQLIEAFEPDVEQSIRKVELTNYWNPVAEKYNKAVRFTGDDPVEADLSRYVTERTVEGLFTMVEKEENKIRQDPEARVTETLKRVFGSD